MPDKATRQPRWPAHQHAGTVASSETETGRRTCSRCAGCGTCRSCAQRRKHAWRLIETFGLTMEQAAERMGLTSPRVRILVAQERDYQDLKRYKLDLIPTERVRAFLEHELELHPLLTRAEVAHYLNMQQIDLDRQLGYEPDKTGRKQRHIGIPAASRLGIALGRAPIDLDGC